MIIAFDLTQCDRRCIATRMVVTREPCPHGNTWQCSHAVEHFIAITTSRGLAAEIGKPGGDETRLSR